MNDAGFEYIAVDYNTVRKGMVADKSLPGMSERQYFKQYGFGISTLYTGLPPQLAEATTPAKIGLGKQNVEIFENLSPADQVAYNRTLFGENPDRTKRQVLDVAIDRLEDRFGRGKFFRAGAMRERGAHREEASDNQDD